MAADKLCVVCCVWCVVCLRGVSCAVRCVLCVLCVVCCYCVIWCCVLCFRVHVEDDIYRQRGLYRCVVVACMLCLVVYCLVLLACLALAWLVLLRRCDVIFSHRARVGVRDNCQDTLPPTAARAHLAAVWPGPGCTCCASLAGSRTQEVWLLYTTKREAKLTHCWRFADDCKRWQSLAYYTTRG